MGAGGGSSHREWLQAGRGAQTLIPTGTNRTLISNIAIMNFLNVFICFVMSCETVEISFRNKSIQCVLLCS